MHLLLAGKRRVNAALHNALVRNSVHSANVRNTASTVLTDLVMDALHIHRIHCLGFCHKHLSFVHATDARGYLRKQRPLRVAPHITTRSDHFSNSDNCSHLWLKFAQPYKTRTSGCPPHSLATVLIYRRHLPNSVRHHTRGSGDER